MSASVFSSWRYSFCGNFLKDIHRKTKAKIFKYNAFNVGQTFDLEEFPGKDFWHMTSFRPGVQSGDCVQINHPDEVTTYQVKKIDFYADPPGMWIAKLLKVSVD